MRSPPPSSYFAYEQAESRATAPHVPDPQNPGLGCSSRKHTAGSPSTGPHVWQGPGGPPGPHEGRTAQARHVPEATSTAALLRHCWLSRCLQLHDGKPCGVSEMIDPKATHPENTQPRAWADATDSLLLETRPACTFSMKYISGSLPRGSGGSQLRTTYVLLVSEACTLVGGPGIWTSPGGGGNTVSAG